MRNHPLNCEASHSAKMYVADKTSEKLYPDDAPNLVPIRVNGDGNCLPCSASLLAFGDQKYYKEMRARIVIELATHEEYYLNSQNLGADLDEKGPKNLAKMYCQHSSHCNTAQLDEESVKKIFRLEVCDVAIDKVWMSIWELHAIASIFRKKVTSIYPKMSSVFPNVTPTQESCVRSELHRTLHPRESSISSDTVPHPAIMWTRMGKVGPGELWSTNHFVPCLPNTGTTEHSGTRPHCWSEREPDESKAPKMEPPKSSRTSNSASGSRKRSKGTTTSEQKTAGTPDIRGFFQNFAFQKKPKMD